MAVSKIQNVLSRGSLVIGAFALMGMVGCAADDFSSEDPTGIEPVAEASAELTQHEVCSSPWVEHKKEWKFYGQDEWLNAWDWYATYNTYVDKYVKYGQREYGIDLHYYDGNHQNFKYEKQGGGDIKYGDSVAIKVGSWGYLYYAPQPDWYGFDLKFSSYPKYEWKIYGGQHGHKVPTGYKVSIYNDYRNDHMVYCKRQYGINLSWANECHDVGQHGRYHKGYCN